MQEDAKHIAGGMLSTFEEYLQGKTFVISWNHASSGEGTELSFFCGFN